MYIVIASADGSLSKVDHDPTDHDHIERGNIDPQGSRPGKYITLTSHQRITSRSYDTSRTDPDHSSTSQTELS